MWCLKGSGMPVLYMDAWWLTYNKEPQSFALEECSFYRNFIDMKIAMTQHDSVH